MTLNTILYQIKRNNERTYSKGDMLNAINLALKYKGITAGYTPWLSSPKLITKKGLLEIYKYRVRLRKYRPLFKEELDNIDDLIVQVRKLRTNATYKS
jgi:hypothetical protein